VAGGGALLAGLMGDVPELLLVSFLSSRRVSGLGRPGRPAES
jgi:hypothetical protein